VTKAIPWVDSGTLVVRSKTLEYKCWGPGPADAPTIVLLHEGLGCCTLWRDFPERLTQATGFGVFAYSRAGYGQSDAAELPRPLDYMTREAKEVVPAVLDSIGFERGVLLGHSDGASIAAIYAGTLADHRVRGLIVMAPHFFTEENGLKEIAAAKAHKTADNAFKGWNDAWLHPEFKEWDVSDVIDYLRIPVLAIQGRDDQYGTLAQIEEIRSRCYSPVDTYIVENCRHSPHLEQATAVLQKVSDYCRRLQAIEAAVPDFATPT